MQVSTNDKLIKQRGRTGTYASFAGLAVLVVGMVASFQMKYLWVSLGAILVGFGLAQYGSYSLRRWGRSPRPDEVLVASLKGFDDRYHFYAWSLPVPYVLLGPQGVYAFTTRDQTGAISVTGSRWQSKLTVTRILTVFAQEGLGNPTSEALDAANRLNTWIKSKLPDNTTKVEPIIVFIDERAQVQATEPTVPVLDAKSIKKWLRGGGKTTNLKAAEFKALEQLFGAGTGK